MPGGAGCRTLRNNNRLFPLWELYGYICDLNQRLEPAKINSRIVLDGRTYSLGFWPLRQNSKSRNTDKVRTYMLNVEKFI